LHRALDDLTVRVFGVVFERPIHRLLGRDLGFGGHLWEA
jgi:hypothetical protein